MFFNFLWKHCICLCSRCRPTTNGWCWAPTVYSTCSAKTNWSTLHNVGSRHTRAPPSATLWSTKHRSATRKTTWRVWSCSWPITLACPALTHITPRVTATRRNKAQLPIKNKTLFIVSIERCRATPRLFATLSALRTVHTRHLSTTPILLLFSVDQQTYFVKIKKKKKVWWYIKWEKTYENTVLFHQRFFIGL